MSNRYIIGDANGWLRVRLEPSGEIIALPEYLRVDYQETRQEENSSERRDYFTIYEGVYRGKKASVRLTSQGKTNLGFPLPVYRGPARLVFNTTKGEITYNGNKRIGTLTYPRSPIPQGTHNIQIPDFPHQLGNGYLGQSVFSQTWFLIGTGVAVQGQNARYLHPGQVTAGCATTNPDQWTDLYRFLILSRQGDRKNVGTLKVI
ncbi:MAG: hypothetical protein HY774_20715 [Acidobacteria bacterium]|nr:hypothetical protein [Acidobacteriota bacterium]